MNSLYELDSKWKRLLTKDNLLGGLTVNEFVEQLGKDHTLRVPSKGLLSNISTDNKSTEVNTWDPKPFIRTFESILKELRRLQQENENNKVNLNNGVLNQELDHAYTIKTLQSQLEQVTSQYVSLDSKLTLVTKGVKPLGDKLENSIRQKKQYTKSIELINIYNEFLETGQNSPMLTSLIKSPKFNNQLNAAAIMKSLIVLSKKIETQSIPKTIDTTKRIEYMAESMETTWLDQFNLAYRDNDFTKLNEIAIILNKFNGGVNVISNFINQHEFFIESTQIDIDNEKETQDFQFDKNLLNPDHHYVIYDDKVMIPLLNEITTVIENESQIVMQVFDKKSVHVLQLFIQRVFVQKLEPKINNILNNSLNWSNLLYVRNLHSLHSLIGQFIKDLSTFFQKESSDHTNDDIISTLEQCYSDLFSNYLYDRSRYFDLEKQNLETILIEKTRTLNINSSKEINAHLLTNKLNKMIENGEDISDFLNKNENSSSNDKNNNNNNGKNHNKSNSMGLKFLKDGKNSSRLSQYKNMIKRRLDFDLPTPGGSNNDNNNINNNTNTPQSNVTDSKDNHKLFVMENVDSMLKCVVEAVARVMELIPNKANEYTLELLEIMFVGIVGSYIDSGLEIAYHKLSKFDIVNSELDLTLLKYISTTTEMLNYISISVKSVFLPLLSNSPKYKKLIIEMTNINIKRCEMAINIIMAKLVTIIRNCFVNSLSKQTKKDFIPKTQDMIDQDTLPATETVNLLNIIYSQSSESLKTKNLNNFLTKVGSILYDLLLSHYSKFSVNSMGGIIVTKDIIGYLNVIEVWNIPSLLDKFSTLRELANLFTVKPDLLESLTAEGHLTDVDSSIINAYIANRQDFASDGFITAVKNNIKQYT
ncbi:exocyst complex component Sec10p [Monosporozyma unispora]